MEFMANVCYIPVIACAVYLTGYALIDAFFNRKEELIKRLSGSKDI